MNPSEKTIYLPRPLVNTILSHAQRNSTVEICGLIGSDATNAKSYYAIDNVAKDPSCRFLMDASQQINAMKKMRDKNQELFAIVHSHPTTPAIPSQYDIEENNYKDAFYIIISLSNNETLDLRGYTQKKDSMQEVNVILEDIPEN